VLRLIEMAASAANAASIPCGVCGEMGDDPRATAVLTGLGVTELSMSAGGVGHITREVRRMPLSATQQLMHEVVRLGTTAEVLARIQAFRAGLPDV
jgi:phosphotransferase system enzyme I (PtsI)